MDITSFVNRGSWDQLCSPTTGTAGEGLLGTTWIKGLKGDWCSD